MVVITVTGGAVTALPYAVVALPLRSPCARVRATVGVTVAGAAPATCPFAIHTLHPRFIRTIRQAIVLVRAAGPDAAPRCNPSATHTLHVVIGHPVVLVRAAGADATCPETGHTLLGTAFLVMVVITVTGGAVTALPDAVVALPRRSP
jgi:hypothetical protein